jgi:prolipoprotein diacylglyceryl transferase
VLRALVASIPSPPDNQIGIGPLQLRAYGLAIAIGVLLAIGIARRRWVARGGDEEVIADIAKWAVPAGLVGARLYHVVTDWHRFDDRPWEALFIWQGGLGIPGALLAGVLAGVVVARRRGLPVAELLDVVAPAIPVAQAVGRLGNWFNQELYGRPTDLPWGLEIDRDHRPPQYLVFETFHPTFLYEALWNLGLAALLVAAGRFLRLRPGQLFVGYVLGYAVGRLWVEALRIDEATTIAGLRVNTVVSAVTIVVALAVLVARTRDPQGRERGSGLPSAESPADPGEAAAAQERSAGQHQEGTDGGTRAGQDVREDLRGPHDL